MVRSRLHLCLPPWASPSCLLLPWEAHRHRRGTSRGDARRSGEIRGQDPSRGHRASVCPNKQMGTCLHSLLMPQHSSRQASAGYTTLPKATQQEITRSGVSLVQQEATDQPTQPPVLWGFLMRPLPETPIRPPGAPLGPSSSSVVVRGSEERHEAGVVRSTEAWKSAIALGRIHKGRQRA